MSDPSRVHLFPVRHHSPRTSVVLAAMLARVEPDLVLVEGPADANGLIDVLTHPETEPPVALLAYRTDGQPGSSLWPFARYSPEYVALRWAREHGKEARFIDLTAAQSLALDRAEGEAPPSAPEAPSPYAQITERSGQRSFEEFWEASFEAPEYDEAAFRAALMGFAELVRHGGPRRDLYRARDAIMLAAIERAIADGTAPERIVVVLGAAHAAAMACGDVEPALAATLDRTVPVALTVIPYSFPRLAEQLGYGAGNRAPFFYQRAHDAGGDYRRATLEVLVDFTDHLRLRGFGVSLADTIEAYRLACRLSDLRGKSGPGLDEVREATIATLCRGESAHVDSFLWPTVIGKGVGRVSNGVGKNSLQEEFWTTVARLKLARTDEVEALTLRLADAVHVEISIFLHRLRTLDVPYASMVGTKRSASPEAGSGLETLSRVREAWQCQWTPSTEIALIEAIVLGESLRAATERLLGQRLTSATRVGQASNVLVDAVVTHTPGAVSLALDACERLAAHDDDVPSLATACRALAGLVSYGSNRESFGADEKVLLPLLEKTFARATLRLPFAVSASDEEAPALTEAMRVLHELALTQAALDRDAWIAVLAEVARSFGAHPRCAGCAAGLLVLARLWSDAELDAALRLRISDTSEARKTAEFLIGFLEVNALAIVKNATVVSILDAYLQGLSKDEFRDVVPTLRRAFAELGKTERRYLVESVVAIREHDAPETAQLAARVMTDQDAEQLRAVGDEIAKAMDDLDDLL